MSNKVVKEEERVLIKDEDTRLEEINKHLKYLSEIKPDTVVSMLCTVMMTQDNKSVNEQDLSNKDMKVQMVHIALGRNNDVARIIKNTLEEHQGLLSLVALAKLQDIAERVNKEDKKDEVAVKAKNMDTTAEKVMTPKVDPKIKMH